MPDHGTWITLSLTVCSLLPWASGQQIQCEKEGRPQLFITPSSLSLNRKNMKRNVEVVCQHPDVGGTPGLESLRLSRTLDTSAQATSFAFVDNSGSFQNNISGTPGTKVTGSYQTSIKLAMPSASCKDSEYTYTCLSQLSIASQKVSCLQSDRLTLVADPSDVQLEASPSKSVFSEGDTLVLSCSATIGKTKEVTVKEAIWVWEVKEKGGSWTPLKTNVRLGKLTINQCLKVRNTHFTSNLTGSDNGKSYRCYTVKDGTHYTDSAVTFTVRVDSFIFGLNTAHGAVVLAGILVIVLAVLAAIYMVSRHCVKRRLDMENAMYRDRVLNRLDKLLRYEAELIGGTLRKKASGAPPPPPPPPPPPEVDEPSDSIDPAQVVLEKAPSDIASEATSEASEVESEPESEAEPEPEPEPEPPKRDMHGPIEK